MVQCLFFSQFRSSHWRCSEKKDFKNFKNFIGKRLQDNCLRGKLSPTPKLTLSQTLILTGRGRGGQFFSEAIVWLPPNPKANPDLTQTPILTGGNFSRVAIVQIPRKTPVLESLFIKKRLHRRSFPVKFAKLLRAPTLKKIYNRLLLSIFSALLSLFFSNIYCFISLFLIF